MLRIRSGVLILALASGFAVGACEKKTPAPTNQAGGTTTGAAHDHDHDHDDHGAAVELGEVKVGAFTLKVSRSGEVGAGKEVVVNVATVGSAAAPAAIRAWIGYEDAKGATKAKFEKEDEGYHGHIEAPSPLPADARLWIETEDSAGVRAVASVALTR